MSCCTPKIDGKVEGTEVDRQIEIDSLQNKLKFKLLLLGTGGNPPLFNHENLEIFKLL